MRQLRITKPDTFHSIPWYKFEFLLCIEKYICYNIRYNIIINIKVHYINQLDSEDEMSVTTTNILSQDYTNLDDHISDW